MAFITYLINFRPIVGCTSALESALRNISRTHWCSFFFVVLRKTISSVRSICTVCRNQPERISSGSVDWIHRKNHFAKHEPETVSALALLLEAYTTHTRHTPGMLSGRVDNRRDASLVQIPHANPFAQFGLLLIFLDSFAAALIYLVNGNPLQKWTMLIEGILWGQVALYRTAIRYMHTILYCTVRIHVELMNRVRDTFCLCDTRERRINLNRQRWYVHRAVRSVCIVFYRVFLL